MAAGALDVKPEQVGVGFACKKGLKPVSPNQDSFLVLVVPGKRSVYGVFDGHGRYGHDVSNFVRVHLVRILAQNDHFWTDPPRALTESFAKMQSYLQATTKNEHIDASASGTTISIVIHDHQENKLYVAWVGDSRVVIGRWDDKENDISAFDLTWDHKPHLAQEQQRIEAAGGQVIRRPHYDVGSRVYVKGERYPGLAMSRAMGDLIGCEYAGVSAIPSIAEYDLDFEPSDRYPYGRDQFLLVCSDGVWEFIGSDKAVSTVVNFNYVQVNILFNLSTINYLPH